MPAATLEPEMIQAPVLDAPAKEVVQLVEVVDLPEDFNPAVHSYASVLCAKGDTKTIWNRNNPDEVEAAQKQFEFFTKEKKYAAFRAEGENGEKGELIKKFDPAAERLIYVPPIVGG